MSSVKLRVCNNSGDGFKSSFQLLQSIDDDVSLAEQCNSFNELDGSYQMGTEYPKCDGNSDDELVKEFINQSQCSWNHKSSFETFNFETEEYYKSNDLREFSDCNLNNRPLSRQENIDNEIISSSASSVDVMPSTINIISSEPNIRITDRTDGTQAILWATSFASSNNIKKDIADEKTVRFNLKEHLINKDTLAQLTKKSSLTNSCISGSSKCKSKGQAKDENGNKITIHQKEPTNLELKFSVETDETKSSLSDDEDSNNSSKWDNGDGSAMFDASSFYICDDPISNQYVKSVEPTSNPEDAVVTHIRHKANDFVSESQNHIGYIRNASSKTPDSESSGSLNTSGSGSTTFESAMSSSDMMTPFGSPSVPSNQSSQSNHANKMGINFANLTSENIPGTLCRMGVKNAEKVQSPSNVKTALNTNDVKKTLNKRFEKDKSQFNNNTTQDKTQNKHQNISNQIKINKCTERKLDKLNLLYLDKKNNSPNQSQRKEASQKLCGKGRESAQFHKELGTNNKTTINYTYKNKKLGKIESPCEPQPDNVDTNVVTKQESDIVRKQESDIVRKQESDIVRKQESDIVSTSSSTKQALEINLKAEVCVKPITKNTTTTNEHRSKFTSKIPIPISKTTIAKRKDTEIEKLASFRNESKSNVGLNNKFDKTESISSSGRSECSYRKMYSTFKMKPDSRKAFSKTSCTNSNVNVIRSKYWSKEDKVTKSNILTSKSFNFQPIKKEETKNPFQSNVTSTSYGTTYGKMVRVKTAPIKSTGLMGDKSSVREPIRPDSAWKPGRSSPKLNWFNSTNTKSPR